MRQRRGLQGHDLWGSDGSDGDDRPCGSGAASSLTRENSASMRHNGVHDDLMSLLGSLLTTHQTNQPKYELVPEPDTWSGGHELGHLKLTPSLTTVD
jgi:hypothetical protein